MRIGICGLGTSHVLEFVRRLNHEALPPEEFVDGARVVAIWPGAPLILEPKTFERYLLELRQLGLRVVERPEELLRWADAVFIEDQDGASHPDLATFFLKAHCPLFIDKPLALTRTAAEAIVSCAQQHATPVFSASALRFCQQLRCLQVGRVEGVFAYAPGFLHPRNPGLLHYGLHAVEMLYALLGPGVLTVSAVSQMGGDALWAVWQDGRLGQLSARRQGAVGYGLTAFGPETIQTVQIDLSFAYRDLLQVILPVLAGRPAPFTYDELIETIVFMEAALRSAATGQRVFL